MTDQDPMQRFGGITFAAVAVFILGIVLGIVLNSGATFCILTGTALLVMASNLLFLGDW